MPPLSLLAQHSNVCTTPACYSLSESLLKIVNLTVDPCSDFFEYSCGNWVNSEPVRSPYLTSYNFPLQTEVNSVQKITSFLNGTFEELESIIQTEDLSYHTRDQMEVDRKNFKLTKDYYQSCLHTESQRKLGATPIFFILAEIQNSFFPLTESLLPQNIAKAIATSTLYGVQTLLSMDKMVPNDEDHNNNLIIVAPMDYTTMKTIKNFKSYLHYQADLEYMLKQVIGKDYFTDTSYNDLVNEKSRANNFTLWCDSTISKAVVNFIDLESKLIDMTLFLDEYNFEENTVQGLLTSSKNIDWKTFLTFMVSEDYSLSKLPALFTTKHLQMIDKLLTSTSIKVLQEYWTIRTIQTMFINLKFPASEPAKAQPNTTVPVFLAPSSKEAVISSPEDICSRETSKNFKNIIGRFFTLSTFGASKEKKQAEMFVDLLHSTWLEHLPNTNWVDDATKDKIIQKVEALHPLVAYSTNIYPDWRNPSDLERFYNDVTTDEGYIKGLYSITYSNNYKQWNRLEKKCERDEWSDRNPPHQWNAANVITRNLIEIPIGAFQGLFYNSEQPQYLNFGGLGSVIGHELVHSLDSQGRFYNSSGYADDWFSEYSSKQYNKKSQCFIDQFDAFSLTGPDNVQLQLNGTNVLGENIADSGGLTIALNGYEKYLKTTGITEQTLPGFESFTPKQLFFISHGLFTCSTIRRDGAQIAIDSDEHAPLYFRNIGVFQNNAEFSKAFNCPVNSRMNPEKKCSIW